jgi:hypothetical protein
MLTPYGLVNIYPDEGSVILPNSLTPYQSTRGILPNKLTPSTAILRFLLCRLTEMFMIIAGMSSERRIIYVSDQQKL